MGGDGESERVNAIGVVKKIGTINRFGNRRWFGENNRDRGGSRYEGR